MEKVGYPLSEWRRLEGEEQCRGDALVDGVFGYVDKK